MSLKNVLIVFFCIISHGLLAQKTRNELIESWFKEAKSKVLESRNHRGGQDFILSVGLLSVAIVPCVAIWMDPGMGMICAFCAIGLIIERSIRESLLEAAEISLQLGSDLKGDSFLDSDFYIKKYASESCSGGLNNVVSVMRHGLSVGECLNQTSLTPEVRYQLAKKIVGGFAWNVMRLTSNLAVRPDTFYVSSNETGTFYVSSK